MPSCKDCGTPLICLASPDDHIDPADGKIKEIVGCNTEKFIYGRLLSDVPDYWRFDADGKP